jgi:hypothetical protein
MSISKLALIALLGGALMAFGCSDETSGTGGSAGTAGSGGSAGAGGDGGGGDGGGGGAIDPLCQPVAGECMGGEIDAITQCPVANCDPAPPPTVADACAPDASTDNPNGCASGGSTITYALTLMQIAEDCSEGFNLDDCNGDSCARPVPHIPFPAPDGADGVDNALSSLTPALVPLDTSLTAVDQAFYDSLCGRTNSPAVGVCEGGTEAGDPCALTMECVGGNDDGETCIDDTGCTDVQGTCSTTVATMCLANTDCPSGETCENADVGKCTDVSDDGCANGDGMICADDGAVCTTDADCTSPAKCVADEGTCNLEDDDCLVPIPAAVITFEVDANSASNCANVTVRSIGACSDSGICSTTNATACTSIIDCPDGEICVNTTACDADTGDMGCAAPATCEGGGTTTSILNLVSSDPTDPTSTSCLSGELKPIPTLLLSVPATLGNPSVRMTLSSGGFSHGVLGATMDEATAKLIAASISEIAVLVIPQAFDISDMLTQDTSAACNALSMGLEIGGVTQQ